MTEKRTVTAKKAGEMLIKSGVFSKDTNFPDQAAKRLVKQGVLKGNPPRKEYPKEGYQIEVESIESYIELGKLKPSELVKLCLQLKRELAIEKGEITGDYEQTELDEFIEKKEKKMMPKKPKRPSSGGRFSSKPWEIDKKLPCPICEGWYSASTFKRRHAEPHGYENFEEMYKLHKDKIETMVQEEKSR